MAEQKEKTKTSVDTGMQADVAEAAAVRPATVSIEKPTYPPTPKRISVSDIASRKTIGSQMSDVFAGASVAAQMPQIGAMFRLDELRSTLAAFGQSRMIFQMPELAMTPAFGIGQIANVVPTPLVGYQSPFFEAMERQKKLAEEWKSLASVQIFMPDIELSKALKPIGLASQFDAFPAAKLASNYVSALDLLGTNLASLGMTKDLYQREDAALWAQDAKSNLFGLSSQIDHIGKAMVSLQSDAMKFQRDFEAMRLSFTKEFSLPFVDFRRDVILDSELRSFLSLHGLVEKGLRKLLAFAVFYKGTTKNEVARTLLTAIVLRLEEFLEHLDLLEGLPVSVFGTMSGIAVHALSDLYDIQGELPAIASEIEFLADLWRF